MVSIKEYPLISIMINFLKKECALTVAWRLCFFACAILKYFFQVKKRFQMTKKRKSLTVIHSKDCFLFQGSELNKRKDEIAEIDQKQRLARVDSIFSYSFPMMFLVFNIVYWPYWTM